MQSLKETKAMNIGALVLIFFWGNPNNITNDDFSQQKTFFLSPPETVKNPEHSKKLVQYTKSSVVSCQNMNMV